MKHHLLSLAAASCATITAALAEPPAQPPAVLTANAAPNTFTMTWMGVNAPVSITYFIQVSPDLQSWAYLPEIRSGAGIPIGYGFNTTTVPFTGHPGSYYLRLQYTNAPIPAGQTASTADFDGDGLSNMDEISVHGTAPPPFTMTPTATV